MKMKTTNIGKFDDDELQERGFDDKLPEELEAAAVLKCSPHFLVTANKTCCFKYISLELAPVL